MYINFYVSDSVWDVFILFHWQWMNVQFTTWVVVEVEGGVKLGGRVGWGDEEERQRGAE